MRERVTGLGGVFFRAKDPDKLLAWYREHLGIPALEDGYLALPDSREILWTPFPDDTTYWPADKQVRVNFPVRDLDAMLAQLRADGVEVDDRVEDIEAGRFGWAVDPEGNRFELWQPPRSDRAQ